MTQVYSLEFHYPGDYGNSSTEADALDSAYKAVEQAALIVGVTLRHEYAWPDGSLYLYAWGGDLTALAKELKPHRISFTPTIIPDLTKADFVGHKPYLCAMDMLLGRELPILPGYESVHPRLPDYGAMDPRDFDGYTLHEAFSNGFMGAFGHITHFWVGPPEWAPSDEAVTRAGNGYAVGALLRILFYVGEDV